MTDADGGQVIPSMWGKCTNSKQGHSRARAWPHRRDGDERGCIWRVSHCHGRAAALAAAQLAARQQVVLRHHAQRCLCSSARLGSRVQGTTHGPIVGVHTRPPRPALPTGQREGAARVQSYGCNCALRDAQRCLLDSAKARLTATTYGCMYALHGGPKPSAAYAKLPRRGTRRKRVGACMQYMAATAGGAVPPPSLQQDSGLSPSTAQLWCL